VQRIIEKAGIPTIIISALPPVTRQNGAPRAVAPLVPMGANAGAPHDKAMQTAILKESLKHLIEIESAGTHILLPYQYTAQI
jgi:D-proline reductase (dithiol) PrdB